MDVIYATGFASEPGEMVAGLVLLGEPCRLEAVVETTRRLGIAADRD